MSNVQVAILAAVIHPIASIRACCAVAERRWVFRGLNVTKVRFGQRLKPSRRGVCSPELFPGGNQFLKARVFT